MSRTNLGFCVGALMVIFGAMFLNGWFGYQVAPEEFSDDIFIGSPIHLLCGALPYGAGIVLLYSMKLSLRDFLTKLSLSLIFPGALSLLFLFGTFNFTDALRDWLILVVVAFLIAGKAGSVAFNAAAGHNKTARSTQIPL